MLGLLYLKTNNQQFLKRLSLSSIKPCQGKLQLSLRSRYNGQSRLRNLDER